MITVIIFLLAFLLLGIGFLLSYHKEVSNPEDAYRRDWKGFFWSSLRMMSLAVVTLFLFFVMLCFVGEDDPEDNLSWIGWFIVVTWFVAIPVLVIYVISVVQVIVHRELYINNVSSTNSEQCKLCINGPLYIDARLLWKQAIGSNCS